MPSFQIYVFVLDVSSLLSSKFYMIRLLMLFDFIERDLQ